MIHAGAVTSTTELNRGWTRPSGIRQNGALGLGFDAYELDDIKRRDLRLGCDGVRILLNGVQGRLGSERAFPVIGLPPSYSRVAERYLVADDGKGGVQKDDRFFVICMPRTGGSTSENRGANGQRRASAAASRACAVVPEFFVNIVFSLS